MSESSIQSSFGYRKVPMIDAPPLNVVREGRTLLATGALARLARPQACRVLLIGLAYMVSLSASLWLAYQFRFDFNVPPTERTRLYSLMAWIVPMKLVVLLFIVQFDGLLSYFSIPDLRRLFISLVVATGLLAGIWWASQGELAPPRGVVLADLFISFLALSGIRLLFRLVRERYLMPPQHWHERIERVGIIGAGDVGASLVRELLIRRYLGLRPVAFFDDDPQKWRSRVHNIRVVGSPETLLKSRLKLDKVILAMPSASHRRFREVIHLLRQAQIPFASVPSFDQMATGKVKVTQLRPVQTDDLLANHELHLDLEKIRELLHGKVILVTGAGGSIGAELCRQIASYGPERLLLVEQCEVHLFSIEQELIQAGHNEIIVPVVADILDEQRMRGIFQQHRPQIVFHAAAHKHVALLESDPCEAIKTNSFGAVQLAELALEFGVERFVLLSSDRAVRPKSAMGASKRLAELGAQALFADRAAGSQLVIVRFGDLVGCLDSIVRGFNQQIAAGGPVTITHPNAVCYAMTTAEASGLVVQSVVEGGDGDVLVFDMGQPVRLLDLAYKSIELSGLRPDQDIEIEFVGLRPGENLDQEIRVFDTDFVPTAHPRIVRSRPAPPSWEAVKARLDEMAPELHEADPNTLKLLLKQAVPEYEPWLAENQPSFTATPPGVCAAAN